MVLPRLARRISLGLVTAAVVAVPLAPAASARAGDVRIAVARRDASGVLTVQRVTAPPATAAATAAVLRTEPGVVAADIERSYAHSGEFRRLATSALAPEEQQWALGAMGAPDVWDTSRGASVTVAVVDSGVDARHPDLAGSVLPGAVFVDGSGSSSGNGWTDIEGHGTFVAGIIAAHPNGVGVAGLAPDAKVLPIRVFASSGVASEVDIANAVLWAAAHGARVVNVSLGSTAPDDVLAAAIADVTRRGVLVVAAAGNSGDPCTPSDTPEACGDPVMYPAADPGVLGVGAIDASGRRPTWSESGREVDVAAPGVNIDSTDRGGGYATGDGTSYAAPFVSAAAALLLGRDPHLASAEVQGLLSVTATDLGAPLPDLSTGWGRVAPAAALAALPATPRAGAAVISAPSRTYSTLSSSAARALYGARLVISARRSLGIKGVPGLRVVLWRQPSGHAWGMATGVGITDEDGRVSFATTAGTSATYGVAPVAAVPAEGSRLVTVPVLPRLVVSASRGALTVVRGGVSPKAPSVVLQQLNGATWTSVAAATPSAAGAFAFPGRPVTTTSRRYRVVVPGFAGLWSVASRTLVGVR